MRLKWSPRAALVGAQFFMSDLLGRMPGRWLRSLAARKLLGIEISPEATLYRWREIRKGRGISIGRGTIVGLWSTLDGRRGINLGENVNISSEVSIWTEQHAHSDPYFALEGGPVIVHDRAWLSYRCTILPNVTIGEGAVVAAGSVVTKDVPPFTVVGGIPAKQIGTRSRDLRYDFADSKRGAAWFI